MAGSNIDNFNASFIKYLPGVIMTLNSRSRARNLTKGELKWQGSNLQKAVHVQNNKGVAYIEDGGQLPVAGNQGYQNATAYRKFLSGAVQITDGQLKNAATDENASISATDSELKGLMRNILKVENFMWTRDGTGVAALLGQTTNGASITVDDARLMWDGADYAILDETTPATVHQNFTVSSTARAPDSNGEMVVTLGATMASGSQAATDLIVFGQGNLSMYNRAITGLSALIDDSTAGTFQGITMSDYPRWTSPVLDNSGTARDMSPELFRQMLYVIQQESGGDAPRDMTVLMPLNEAVSFEQMFEGEVRLEPSSKVGGIEVSKFQSALGSVNVVTDPDAPYGKAFFLDPNEITFAVQAELDWRRDGAGGAIFKRSDAFAGYTATALEACELFIEGRNKCGRLDDLNGTVKTAY